MSLKETVIEKINTMKINNQEWEKEWKTLKNEMPEEKAFRNYKCLFSYRYLLQVGYSNFFGNEDWKTKSPASLFSKFDSIVWKKEPDLIKRIIKEMENYFSKNPDKVWCPQIISLYLPKSEKRC